MLLVELEDLAQLAVGGYDHLIAAGEAQVGQTAKVTLSIRYEGPLRAPIAQGEQVAELEIAVEGLRPSRVPLVAAQPIEEANIAERLVNGVAGLF